jgi:hypothetical protein
VEGGEGLFSAEGVQRLDRADIDLAARPKKSWILGLKPSIVLPSSRTSKEKSLSAFFLRRNETLVRVTEPDRVKLMDGFAGS